MLKKKFKNKSKIIIIAVICCVIVAGIAVYNMGSNIQVQNTSNNATEQAYAKKIIDTCKENMHCSVIGLDNLTSTENKQVVLGTFSDLVTLYDVSSYPCHDTAHHLGMWLYWYTKDLNESLGNAQMLCGGAVFHGILENYFSTLRFNHVDASTIDITSICSQDPNNPYSIIRWQCIHGIGHGLSIYYDYNVTTAVSRCDEFEPGWEQISCSKGVFMQNVVHYYETGQGDFDPNDLYYPCDVTDIKYAPACYHYHVSYMLKQNNFHIVTTFDDCDKITPDTLVKACYHGFGRQLESLTTSSVKQAIDSCYMGKNSSYHIDCLKGMLMTVVNRDTNPDDGFKFCNTLENDFKEGCYDSLGQWVTMLYSTPQEREIECSKAGDPNYVNACMSATLHNLDLL